MTLYIFLALVGGGLLGGFIAGLIGLGGGVIFAPVLLFLFQRAGVPEDVAVVSAVATSLFGVCLASIVSARTHYTKGSMRPRVSALVGAITVVSFYAAKEFITTQPWFTPTVFQAAFGVLLLVVAWRMSRPKPELPETTERSVGEVIPQLVGTGLSTGVISASLGIGGGMVLVPAFSRFLKYPIRRAVGTSSGAIVITAFAGVLIYSLADAPGMNLPGSVGYVNFLFGVCLAGPALITAQLGARVAHAMNTLWLKRTFAVIAVLIGLRMMTNLFFS